MTRNYDLNSEHHEQRELFRWADLSKQAYPQLRSLFAIPNGGWRHPVTASKLKAEGVKPGVPDICLAWPSNGYPGLFIEMKRRVGGKLSEDQREWRDNLTKAGYCVVLCRGWEEARKQIIQYLTITGEE